VHRYFSKGDRILICGEVRPRSYKDKNGETRYITLTTEYVPMGVFIVEEINVNEVEFCESPKSRDNGRNSKQEDFLPDDDTSLPFDF
jgi:single-stranded DNA-binding protein